ncbi:MAG: ImmA/IrrE family metallo-endopeptidase [Clostridia bacterium]|nr:ImmA/IrrE family metallo-endopeptidase [Clostridia bacterium]
MNYIVEKAVKLSGYSDSRDPFEICNSAGVNVVFADIGELKGMYKYIKRNRYIVISDKLDEKTARIVCAHELGHDVLHRSFAKNGLLMLKYIVLPRFLVLKRPARSMVDMW